MLKKELKYEAIVIGSSAGGLFAISFLLQELPVNYPLPVIIVQHRAKDQKELLEQILQYKCKIKIKQADEKEKIEAGTVYIAPPDYHLLIEEDRTFSLAGGERVKFAKPSINVLFESAAAAYRDHLVAIILTGANDDGAEGIKSVSLNGGLTVAQDPDEAQYTTMPTAAIETKHIQKILTLSKIKHLLLNLSTEEYE